MRRLFSLIIKARWVFILLMLAAALLCAYLRTMVAVNYDMNTYLPENAASTIARDTMKAEFEGAIPNARIMIRGVSRAEALEYKDRIAAVDVVSSVMWLDDATYMEMPLEMYDPDTLAT